MCRLLLMNREAFDLIDHQLVAIFRSLMESFGGHGNGVADLWPEEKRTRVSKSVRYDEHRAVSLLRRYRAQSARWFLCFTQDMPLLVKSSHAIVIPFGSIR